MSEPRAGAPLAYAAPYRKVTGVVRLRVGWAVFLECDGHIAFIDRLGRSGPRNERPAGRDFPAYATAEDPSAAIAPKEAWPARMRCLTCAGISRVDRPFYLDRHARSPEEVQAALDRDLEGPWGPRRRLAEAYVAERSRALIRRVRRDGLHETLCVVASACGRGRRGLGPRRAGT